MEKQNCPSCKTENVIVENFELHNKTVTTFLCVRCGYTSNSEYKINSPIVQQIFDNKDTSKLILDLHIFDENTSLFWFPIVLMKNDGGIFPEGTLEDWKWSYVPIIKIKEDEKEQYGSEFETRFAVELKEVFDKYDFLSACKKLGLISQEIMVD